MPTYEHWQRILREQAEQEANGYVRVFEKFGEGEQA
jgi:hypothetical protein